MEPTRRKDAPPRGPGPDAGAWDWPTPTLAGLVYFGLAVVYFLPAFLPGNHLYGSDYLAAGYFSHEFVSRRLAAGELPVWAPHLYGGVPWFANPGSTFFPFRFLVDLLFAPHRIFAGMFVIQFTLAGLGTYLLAREIRIRRWVAFVAGLAFMFTGLVMSFVLAGHDGRIIVATFAPLFLFFLHRGVRTGGVAWFAGAALALGFSLLSFQIQSNYYLLLLGAGWGVFALLTAAPRTPRALTVRTGLGLGSVAAAFLLAAINFLPFLGYVDASPRGEGGRGYDYATSWSMPPAEITGLALPEHAGLLELYQGPNPVKLHTEYVGAVVVLLVALGFLYARRNRYWWFFTAAGAVALTFAFGGHTPLYRLYYALLPGTTMFRAPSISFFVVSLALVMMAALALEALAGRREATAREGATGILGSGIWLLIGVPAVSLLIMLVAGGSGDPHGRALAQGALRLFLASGLAAGALWAWAARQVTTPLVAIGLAIVTVGDLWVVDRKFFEVVDAPATMMAPDEVVDFLRGQEERARVWVLPGEVQGGQAYGGGLRNYLMRFDIDLAGGEHGNQLQSYNEFAGTSGATYVDWHNYLADLQGLVDPTVAGANPRPNFLAAANIRYVIATVLLPRLPEAFRGRTGVVYEIPSALPRAYVVDDVVLADAPEGALEILRSPEFDPARSVVLDDSAGRVPGRPAGGGPAGSAELVSYDPARVVVRASASRPALLVLADNYYPGWEATVDDEPAPVYRANHTFRAVPVPAGSHEVVFEFRPPGFRWGLWISAATLLALLGLILLGAWPGRERDGRRPGRAAGEA